MFAAFSLFLYPAPQKFQGGGFSGGFMGLEFGFDF
jgi:hypothetical protein